MRYFGWDVSTSITACSVFDDEGKYFMCSHIDMRKIDSGEFKKEKAIHEFIRKMAAGTGFKDSIHFVEDKQSGFSRGLSSQQTLIRLAGFNAVTSYLIKDTFSSPVYHIHTSTIKAVMAKNGLVITKGSSRDQKKSLTHDFFVKHENHIVALNRNDKPQPWEYDIADSYVIGRAGFLSREKYGNSTQKSGTKKSSGGRRKSKG